MIVSSVWIRIVIHVNASLLDKLMVIAAFLTKLVDLDIMERLTCASNDFGFQLESALQNVEMSAFCSMVDGFIGRNKDSSLIHLTHNCCFEGMEKRGLSLSLPHILTLVLKTDFRAHRFVLNRAYYLTGTKEIQPYLILQQLKNYPARQEFLPCLDVNLDRRECPQDLRPWGGAHPDNSKRESCKNGKGQGNGKWDRMGMSEADLS